MKNPFRQVSFCIGHIIALCLVTGLTGCHTWPRTSPTPATMTAHAYAERLGRGINMGNALDAPKEGEWGVTIDPEYFRLIREKGFDSVRIPIRWSAHAETVPPYAIAETFFERVDEVIEMALEQELAVVINIHHYEELMKDPAAHLPRFLSFWQQIGERYRNHPPTLSFELLNEPTDDLSAVLWNEFLRHGMAVARATNPHRILIIGTAEWGGLRALDKLDIPKEAQHVIVTFHYYEPFPFTHQGAEWLDNSNPWLGTTWEGTTAQKQAIIADMDRVAQWANDRNLPLYMGEFGAYRKADMDSRARWTDFVAREAEARNIPWAYWEFCSGFGIYDAQNETWKQPLVDALIPR